MAESARKEDFNGYIEIDDNPISKVGIFPYLGSEIDPGGSLGLDAEKIYRIYRPAEELDNQECVDSFKLVPWVIDHEMVGDRLGGSDTKRIEGVTGEKVYFDPIDKFLKANLRVFSRNLKEILENGKKELSIGYVSRYDMTPGIFDGEPYDGVQRDLRGNHLALVREGRAGKDVRVLDSRLKTTLDSKKVMKEIKEMKDSEMSEEKAEEIAKDELTLESLAEKLVKIEEVLAKLLAEEKAEAEQMATEDRDEIEEVAPQLDEKKETEHPKMTQDELIKKISFELAQKDMLAKKLYPIIGVFDHAAKSLSDVAKYGVNRLKIRCTPGHELTALESYLMGVDITSTQKSTASVSTADSKVKVPQTFADTVDKYLRGE